MSKKPVILVDGSSYLFRAFHALPDLQNSEGQHTGAMLGVLNMLKRLIDQYQPEYAVVIFDAKGKTFRHEAYPEYKANRPPMNPDLAQQIEPLHELIQAYGLPILCTPGVEADDVIGSLAYRCAEAQRPVVISTGDKDMAQLVGPYVTLVDTMKDTTMDAAGVEAKFGVSPAQIQDYLALIGDTSDNIPGVPKVGPKTAVKWMQAYGSLDDIIAAADDITGKVGQYLREHLPLFPTTRHLVQIKTDLETPDISSFAVQYPDDALFTPLLEKWEFTSWLKRVPKRAAEYEAITTEAALDKWLARCREAAFVAVDLETTSLDPFVAKWVGISFGVGEGEAAYLPLDHNPLTVIEQLPFKETVAKLKPLLEDASIPKVGQHFKYDMEVLTRYGIEVKGLVLDTMLASYILECGLTRHNMDALAKRHLQHETISYESVAGKGAKQICFSDVPLDQATQYAAEDADVTWQLARKFFQNLDDAPTLKALYTEEEHPMLFVLMRMEQAGVLVDAHALHQQSQDLAQALQTLEEKAYGLAGKPFNLASTKQLREVFYETLALPVIKKTPKGEPSTAEEVLQQLALEHELPALILEHRHMSKLKSTYTDKLPGQINHETGRIHTRYHQAGTSTGRLSSSDPNLQNIPIRTALGRKIREAFVAPEGSVLVSADYSQVELRIMAHLSSDEGLLKAFSENGDIHRATASEVFDVPFDEVDDEHRRRAKAINFGLIYGMSAFGLAKQISVSRDEAQQFIDTYFARYPGVKRYMEETQAQAAEKGYVETLYGRRLYTPDIKSSNGIQRKAAERAAINAPMQGTCADIMKRAMISIDQWLQETGCPAKMILQVHDELVFQVEEASHKRLLEEIVARMSGAADLSIPLLVSTAVSQTWQH